VDTEVVIDPRFRGPPRSANGGYACGVVAEAITGVATVSLRVPPPLGRSLRLRGDGEQSKLTDGETLVGEGIGSSLDLEVPAAPDLSSAAEASLHYSGFVDHPFEGCFVCGPARTVGDGLRIFAGLVGDTSTVAAPWTPDRSLQGGDGSVDRRHVWAALDCPSYFALAGQPKALLGRLTAQIDRLPEVGEPLVAFGWPIAIDGRKLFSGSGLADADGEVFARAAAIWIEIDRLPV
jgi:hypothetical protein